MTVADAVRTLCPVMITILAPRARWAVGDTMAALGWASWAIAWGLRAQGQG